MIKSEGLRRPADRSSGPAEGFSCMFSCEYSVVIFNHVDLGAAVLRPDSRIGLRPQDRSARRQTNQPTRLPYMKKAANIRMAPAIQPVGMDIFMKSFEETFE